MVSYKDELRHHGILGQKWGVRRFRNKDGSLTPAGERRYYHTSVETAAKKYIEASNSVQSAKTQLERSEAEREKAYAKQDLKAEKIKYRINREKKISKHRQKLEAEYRAKGMTDEEAAVAAYKRARTEKIIAAVGATALVAATAYVAYRHYDKYVDKMIPADTVLSRVTKDSDKGVYDAFYASYNSSDNNKYIGLYGNQMNQRVSIDGRGLKVYQKSIGLAGDLKVASEKTARNAMAEMFDKNPKLLKEFKNSIYDVANNPFAEGSFTEKQWKAIKNASSSLKKGKMDSRVYDAFNMFLAKRDDSAKEFYDTLKSKGYDAVADINDKRLSGYGSKSPVIVFNKSKVVVDKVRELSTRELRNANRVEMNKLAQNEIMKQYTKNVGAAIATIGGSYGAGKVVKTKHDNNIVAKYREEHPNTKLSYNEILRNYERKHY